jgi:two-component system, NarL family, response regulator EvgA
MSNVLIVDDHPVIRLVVRSLLESEGHTVMAETDNGIDAYNLAKDLLPDLIILDLTLPQLEGLEVIERFRSLKGPMRVLVFTSHNPVHFSVRCKIAGASGFVWKQGDLTDLMNGVKAVLSGYTYFPNVAVQDRQLDDSQLRETEQLANLSNRELTVLQYLAEGMLNKDIAERMLISYKTVSTYKTRLLLKLNVSSLLELIEFAKRNGIVDKA